MKKHNFKLVKDSNQEIDINGYLHCKNAILTEEGVSDYLGMEIPNYKDFDLDPNKIYKVYRPLSVLEENIDTFNNVPVTLEHPNDLSAENYSDVKTYGASGEQSKIENGKLLNNIIIYDNDIIELIKSNQIKSLSCGYFWEVEPSKNSDYDFVITKIAGNHIAIVKEPRIETAKIVDSASIKKNIGDNMKKLLKFLVKDSEDIKDSETTDSLDEFKAELANLLEKYELTDKLEIEFKEKVQEDSEVEDESQEEAERHEAVKTGEYDVEHDSETLTKDEVKKMMDEFKKEIFEEMKAEDSDKEEAAKDAEELLGDVSCGAQDAKSIRKMILDSKGITTKGMSHAEMKGAVKALKLTKKSATKQVIIDSNSSSFSADFLQRIGG